jgi:hypothetical protein
LERVLKYSAAPIRSFAPTIEVGALKQGRFLVGAECEVMLNVSLTVALFSWTDVDVKARALVAVCRRHAGTCTAKFR